jgi:hypothetical protein
MVFVIYRQRQGVIPGESRWLRLSLGPVPPFRENERPFGLPVIYGFVSGRD